MKRYSFSSFQVDDANRAAYEICHAVAELQPATRLPVVLLADAGCGKTHLLYAIVNHVRVNSDTTGLAFITARAFPDAVRGLIRDPAPLQRAERAILLVDQLEAFKDHVEELGAVTRIFLDNKHYVVFAASMHPGRIGFLPEGLRAILKAGQVIRLEAPASLADRSGVQQDGRPEAAGLTPVPRDELRQLRAQLATVEKDAAAAVVAAKKADEQGAALRQERGALHQKNQELAGLLEEARAETQQLQGQLDAERTARASLAKERDEASDEIQALRQDLEKGLKENAQLAPLKEEADRLREALERARADLDAARQEREVLRTQAAEKTILEEEVLLLRQNLDETRAEGEQARAEADRLLGRTQELLEQVQASAARFNQSEETLQEQFRDLGAMLAGGDAMAVTAEGQAGMSEDDRDKFEAELADAKAEARNALRARDEALEKFDRLTAANAALELEIEETKAELAAQAKEMEALRHEAVTQAAVANTQAGETERQYSQLHSTVDLMRQTTTVVGAGLQNVQQQLAETSEAMGRLAKRLAMANGTEKGRAPESPAYTDEEKVAATTPVASHAPRSDAFSEDETAAGAGG